MLLNLAPGKTMTTIFHMPGQRPSDLVFSWIQYVYGISSHPLRSAQSPCQHSRVPCPRTSSGVVTSVGIMLPHPLHEDGAPTAVPEPPDMLQRRVGILGEPRLRYQTQHRHRPYNYNRLNFYLNSIIK